jgi:hypothetical protein
MSMNNKQPNKYKKRWEAFLELQILRFFTTLVILTIVFVLVLRFVQQTSISSDKIKPAEASLGLSSVDTLFDVTRIKSKTYLVPEVNSPYLENTFNEENSSEGSKKITK